MFEKFSTAVEQLGERLDAYCRKFFRRKEKSLFLKSPGEARKRPVIIREFKARPEEVRVHGWRQPLSVRMYSMTTDSIEVAEDHKAATAS